MAEPIITGEVNENTEASPNWVAIEVAVRWTGAAGIGNPFRAGIGDAADAFFDGQPAPNDGQFWHDKNAADARVAEAGRNDRRNVLRIRETGGADGTASPPAFTAFDDDTDAVNRADPTSLVLLGTPGSQGVSLVRGIETTAAAPPAGWQSQVHDQAPTAGNPLWGNNAGNRVDIAAILAPSGSITLNLAACAPHDSPAGLSSFVYAIIYDYV